MVALFRSGGFLPILQICTALLFTIFAPSLLRADTRPSAAPPLPAASASVGVGVAPVDPSAAAATDTRPPAATDVAAPSAANAGGSLDFNFFEEPKPDPAAQAVAAAKTAEIERKTHIRRKVLVAHQALGFTTLAVLGAALIVGQFNYVARYGSYNNGMDYDRFQTAHLGLTISSTALFTTLGVLGVAAPNPYPKPFKFDAALVHKVAMILATAGMVTQMVLGPITASYEGQKEQRNLALGHLITGYATYGFMTAGVLAFVF